MNTTTIKVLETTTNTKMELTLTAKKGRLTLADSRGMKKTTVYGCGCKKENMLADLNRCSVSKQNKLNFVKA